MISKNENIFIEILNGGFVMEFPVIVTGEDNKQHTEMQRQVFSSPRKLINKVKEVVETMSTVADEKV